MNSHKQWIRDPEHPTQWILNPNFRPSQEDPPSMQIQPIEEPVIQLPVEIPQADAPSMQIQPIREPIIQLPVERPHVELPQVAPSPPVQVQPIADPIRSPGLIVDSHAPPTPPALFHPGFLCLGPDNCPHFSHQTQMPPPRGPPASNIIILPVTRVTPN